MTCAQPASEAPDHPPATPPHLLPTPPCILLVEDDGMMREMMARELRRAGYRVLAASRCDTAFEHLQHEGTAIDLLLCDYRLPPFTALDLVAQIRAAGHAPAVLICSGLFLPATVAALDAARLPHRLQKPFTFTHLCTAVHQLLPLAPPASRAAEGA